MPKGFGSTSKLIQLSLCAIAKNEAHRLGRCLESVSGFVDEIVLVDTGSTDNTTKIAKKFGAKVYQFPWCDDFSAARNHALSFAKGKWILVLDADEELAPDAKSVLSQLMQRQDCLAINLIRHEIGAQQSPFSCVSRLFRRRKDLHFTGIYHELIDHSVEEILKREPHWQILTADITAIQHDGYRIDGAALSHKREFARRLMHKHLETYPQDSYTYSKLGALYVDSGDVTTGLKLLKTGLDIAQNSSNNPQILFELYYHLGIACAYIGEREAAQNYYQQALDLDILPIVKLPAYNNLGNICQAQGQHAMAIAAYQQVVAIAPSFAKGYYNFGIALKSDGQLDRARSNYERAIALDPEYADAHQNLGVVLVHLGQRQKAIAAFHKAILLHEQQQNFARARELQNSLQSLGLV